jgi:hypothetical protein
MSDPVKVFARWLEYLDSHDGRLHRARAGQRGTDADIACTLPTPPGKTIVTVGDLRRIVGLLKRAGGPTCSD